MKNIETEVAAFHREHVAPYPDLPEVALLIAAQKGQTMPRLMTTDRGTVTTAHQNAAIGIGMGHSQPILDRIGVAGTVNKGIILAAYAIHSAKSHVADCGDMTSVGFVEGGIYSFLPPKNIADIDSIFDEFANVLEPDLVGDFLGFRSQKRMPTVTRRIEGLKKELEHLASGRITMSGREEFVGFEPD